MFNLLRTRDIKSYLKAGNVFKGYDTRFPQFTSFRLVNGKLEEYRRLQHPIQVDSPPVEIANELVTLLEALPTDSILLTTMGHTRKGVAVEVVADLVNDSDEIIREELGLMLHLTKASPPLEIGFVRGYTDFIDTSSVDNGKVLISTIDGKPAVHNIASSKLGRLRIAAGNVDSKGNSQSTVYLLLESDSGYMRMYYRQLPNTLQQALTSNQLSGFIGQYVEFSYRSITNWQGIQFGDIIVEKEIISFNIYNLTSECNGNLLS